MISGTTPIVGTYKIRVTATNARGSTTRELRIVAGDTLSLTPPMGWNSWNCFASKVTRDDILRQANAMATSGLRDHGYAYINIDDFWMPKNEDKDSTLHGPERDAEGRINSNARFPDMPGLTASIHKFGLKAGIYSSPGPKTCGGCISSWQHEKQDAERFAEWGFDYLKYDWCSYNQVVSGNYEDKAYAKKPYMVMGEHLRQQKRDIVYSLCQYGMAKVWEWGGEVGGNTWRTTHDIGDSWNSMSKIGLSQAGHEPFVKPGCWNDPDMMIAGWVWGRFTNLSDDEQYTHVTLWTLQAAPLLLGCDLTHLDEFTLNLLGNDEVIEVNQDPLGRMAGRIAICGDTQVWAKAMSDGSMAVGLFNLGDETVPVSTTWNELKLKGPQRVRDVWRQQDIGIREDVFTTDIPRHGCVLIRVSSSK
ncbi:MAG: glycoside hydrolase family 27 protein [Planctomycetes bacterium]|nr:glycoside hydrolase family 27 protein [Planctomycetota bacterium]